jgi:hypothetical protein
MDERGARPTSPIRRALSRVEHTLPAPREHLAVDHNNGDHAEQGSDLPPCALCLHMEREPYAVQLCLILFPFLICTYFTSSLSFLLLRMTQQFVRKTFNQCKNPASMSRILRGDYSFGHLYIYLSQTFNCYFLKHVSSLVPSWLMQPACDARRWPRFLRSPSNGLLPVLKRASPF